MSKIIDITIYDHDCSINLAAKGFLVKKEKK